MLLERVIHTHGLHCFPCYSCNLSIYFNLVSSPASSHALLIAKSDKPRQHIKKKRHYFANKGPYSQSYGFSSSHVWMWDLDHKESWVLKNWCFWTVVLEKTLESPLDCTEIKPVNSKGNQSWIFIRGTYAEAEALILWPPDLSHWKSPWCWERLKAGGEGDSRGWDGWMVSLTQWAWVWASSKRRWRTGKPGMLQSMGSQRVRHNWATEQHHLLIQMLWLHWAHLGNQAAPPISTLTNEPS